MTKLTVCLLTKLTVCLLNKLTVWLLAGLDPAGQSRTENARTKLTVWLWPALTPPEPYTERENKADRIDAALTKGHLAVGQP